MMTLRKTVLLGLVVLAIPVAALAQDPVPHVLNVQGIMRNVAGEVVSGTYTLTFRLYTDATAGTKLFEVTPSPLSIVGGLFNVGLTIPTNIFASNPTVWLEIQVGTDLLPRRQITSVGYALMAERSKECTTLLGDATGLVCTACVQKTELDTTSIKYALGDVAEGAAVDVKCDSAPCISSAEIVDGTITGSDIGPSQIDSTKLASNLTLSGDTTMAANLLVKGNLYTGASIGAGTLRLDSAGALGNITTMAMSGQLTNTKADGTAPFVITSRTRVANLNADLLDGQEAAYFLNASNLTSGTVSSALLPKATTTTLGAVQVGTGINVASGVISNGGVLAITPTAPIQSSGGQSPTLSVLQANASQGGYLSATDWNTFNNKLTTVSVTAPVTGNGTSGSPLGMTQASTSTNGWLSSTDWNTFNGKAPATGSANYIQNQGAGAQASSNFWISGNAKANGDVVAGRLCLNGVCKADWASVTDNYWTGNTGSKLIYTQDATWKVGIGTTSPSVALDVNGDMLANNIRNYYLTRTLPTVANQWVQIGNFSLTNGAHNLDITVTVSDSGFSMAKRYVIPLNYNINTDWQVAQPISDTGAYSGNDFELDVFFNTDAKHYLRLRRTGGSTAGTAIIHLQQRGSSAAVFTAQSGTGSATAPAAFLSSTPLTQLAGNVGIGTDAPAFKLDVNGIARVGTAYLTDANTALAKGSNNSAKITTNYGYVEMGPQNASWSHFQTDRPQFYFNKPVYVDGNLSPYTNNATSLGDATHVFANGYFNKITLGGVERSGWGSFGSGTQNRVAKWANASTLGDSIIFDNGTNVGIGTTAPASKLDVRGGGYISTRDADSYGAAFMEGGNGIAYHGAIGTSRLAFGNSTNYERMTILDNGNVGINQNAPTYKLEVNGSMYSASLTTGAISAAAISGTTGSFSGNVTSSTTVTGATVTSSGALNGATLNVSGASALATSSGTARVGPGGGVLNKDGALQVGGTAINYAPSANNWNYTLLLNASDMTSIGFHDAGNVVGSIRFQGNNFYLGYDDGWGAATVNFGGTVNVPGSMTIGGDLNITGKILGAGAGMNCGWGNQGGSGARMYTNGTGSGATTLDASSNQWQPIPGLSATFTLPKKAYVTFTVNGTQRAYSGGYYNEGYCHIGYRWKVDGTGWGHANWGNRIQMNRESYDHWKMVTLTGGVEMAAGAHTVFPEVRGNGTGCTVCGETDGSVPGYAACTLTINATYIN